MFLLLPPTYEGWGKVIVCLSVHTWGEIPHLHPIILSLVPCPFWGYPSDWSQVPSWRGSSVTGPRFLPGGLPLFQMGSTQDRVPCGQGWGIPLSPGQHREYLLRGGQYVSCVNAGGFSCVRFIFTLATFFVRIRERIGGKGPMKWSEVIVFLTVQWWILF